MPLATDTQTMDQALAFLNISRLGFQVRTMMVRRYGEHLTAIEDVRPMELIRLFGDRQHTPFDANNCGCHNRHMRKTMWHRDYWTLMHQAIPVCNLLVWQKLVGAGYQQQLLRAAKKMTTAEAAPLPFSVYNRFEQFVGRPTEFFFAKPGDDDYVLHPGW